MFCLVWCFWIIFQVFFNSLQIVKGYTNITWETDTRIIHIGETVILTCTVHGIDAIDPGETRQWSKDSSLVCYNGKPTNSLKYKELIITNKFQLLIYNVTEADLNCEYQCLYSFQTFTKKLEITTTNFEYPPTENTTELDYNYTMNGSFSVKLHLKKVFPRPNCTVSFQALQHTFAERMYKKIGLYFEVHLLHMSNVILDAITTFNVTCLLQKEHLVAEGEIGFDKGGQHVIYSDDSSTLPDLDESVTLPDSDEIEPWILPVFIPLSILLLLLSVLILVCYCVRSWKKKENLKGEAELRKKCIHGNTDSTGDLDLEEDGQIVIELLPIRSQQKRLSESDCSITNT